MGALNDNDLFLINRKISGDWKSYSVKYKDLKVSINADTIADPVVWKNADPLDVNEVTGYNAESLGAITATVSDIQRFVFHASVPVAKVQAGESFQVFNVTQVESAIYKATENGSSGVVKVSYESGTFTTFAVDDILEFRTLNSSGGGGGSINIGVNPPIDPEEGTLWYNPNNGITYIWYVNIGTSGDGQWVDVRPGGGGGGGGTDGVDFSIGDGLEFDITTDPDTLNVVALDGKGIEVESTGIKIGDDWSNIPTLPV